MHQHNTLPVPQCLMSFFYSFPSELVRLQLNNNSVLLEYPRDRFYSTILVFLFANTCLFVLAAFAFSGYGVQLFVLHVDLLLLLFVFLLLLQKGLEWAQTSLAAAESVFALTNTYRRDVRTRLRPQEELPQHHRPSSYEHSVLRKKRQPPTDQTAHEIDIDMSKLNSALKNGNLFA